MSALSLAALAVAQQELAKGVRGGLPGWGRFRSAEIDDYMREIDLNPHVDHAQQGWPWCAAAIVWCFEKAISDAWDSGGTDYGDSPCPKTAGALHLWELAPLTARTQLPAPGDVFVLDRGKGRGHVGFVVTASPGGNVIGTLEPDTSSSSSATGDAWGEHPFWSPSDGARGKLVGYLNFG